MDANSQARRDYFAEWKKVDGFVKQGLPQSALAEVKKIYSLAKKDKEDAQVVKALIYMAELQGETREDNPLLSIAEIEKEIPSSEEPARSLLHSLLADQYTEYFEMHRWELHNRTQTRNFKKDDIATWTIEDLHEKISHHYFASVSAKAILQKTSLENFDAIIHKGNVRHLRPTLYDLLANQALDFFESDERSLHKPAYAFEITDEAAFAPAAEFTRHHFTTKDTLSLKYKALLMYQELIAFHLKDAKPDALIDVDLERIRFVFENSIATDKEEHYVTALTRIGEQYKDLPAASQAWFLLAQYYTNKGETYTPYGDTTHRYSLLKAKDILDRVLAQKDSSEGKINSYNLLNQLKSRRMQFGMEKINVPNQPFRALVTYKNFQHLYIRVIKADAEIKKLLERSYEQEFWPALIRATPARSWDQALPPVNDLQAHSVEIKIDALPVGEYMVLMSTHRDFSDKKAMLGARHFYVSNISFVHNKNDVFVLNRETGQPLNGASVQVWYNNYDSKLSKYVKVKDALYRADANGHFQMDRKEPRRYASLFLEITHGSDRLFLDEQVQNPYYEYEDPKQRAIKSREAELEAATFTYLYTDRSLYRPGQLLSFKGISITSEKDKEAYPRKDYRTSIYLRDANHQVIDSLSVSTNEYGSFAGSFNLPEGSLNGVFTLEMASKRGSRTIRVEEYKRPKFYVEYEPVRETYRVNDSITVTGVAKAYAGNNIDGAMVMYRVVRQPRFLYPWLYGRGWFPQAPPMEIAQGVAETDRDGKFEVTFKAIPDLTVTKRFDPVFDYTVYADVTDINGETRSATQSITAGFKALILNLDIPERIEADSLTGLSLRTENMNGQFIPTIVNIQITALKAEQRLVRERLWERPDQFVMSKEEYIRNFPHDEYDNETDPATWAKERVAVSKTDSARAASAIPLGIRPLPPGFYAIEISTKDKFGEDVKLIRYVEIYDSKSKELPLPQYMWTKNSAPIEPGQTTTLGIGSSAKDVYIIQQIEKRKGNQYPFTSEFSLLRLNEEKKALSFGAQESDRGGYGVSFVFVKHNRVYQFGQTIVVPWTNKEIDIEYATFRDKTLPGSEEKWTLKLKGHDQDRIAAEMLVSMYDASLDQFYSHQWTKPGIWKTHSSPLTWVSQENFAPVYAQVNYVTEYNYKELNKQYDRLLFAEQARVYGMPVTVRGANKAKNVALEGALEEVSAQRLDRDGDGMMDQASPPLLFDMVGRKVSLDNAPSGGEQGAEVQVRKNFNETAFFFPQLITGSDGSIGFSFTIPEALTRWKLQALAHTKELAFGYSSREVVTQKQLMVQPNAPRFIRQGDKIAFSVKIANLSGKALSGQAELQLLNTITGESINSTFRHSIASMPFSVAADQSVSVSFPIEVPSDFADAITWKVVAKAGSYSDGEENSLPVLSNRMLVTETLPLTVRGTNAKTFSFDKLLKSAGSNTLKHQSLTVEYTSNPVWYAIQSLPYLVDYPYDCSEQTWNRYYANSLASMIAVSSPRIMKIFDTWAAAGNGNAEAMLSNLQKNQELKSVLLEETPWVLQAKTEQEQKKNIAMLFDIVKMSGRLNGSFEKLKQMQLDNGGFPWFKDGPDDRYITQYILTGIGHLRKLNAVAPAQQMNLAGIVPAALAYLDAKIDHDYDLLVKNKTDLSKYVPSQLLIQYLYMRSFFPETKIPAASQKAYTYFRERAQKTWTGQTKYMQGMLVLALARTGDTKTPAAILRSLKETAIIHDELGMYWKSANRGWWWHEAPIERQALLIEAFQEIGKDTRVVDDLRTWLLKNKQTNSWESTKATAEACYALLLQGTNWRDNEQGVEVKLGTHQFSSAAEPTEAGTGYFKKVIEAKDIEATMGNITVKPTPRTGGTSNSTSWGAVYWQYFEDLDKITKAATPLSLDKKLFIQTNSDRGPVLNPVKNGDLLSIGDKVTVRIELKVDRDMEYVHMKDMRASAMEPINVLSGYKWQGGLGYYETTKDASTNFFFNYLARGTYVFEYSLFVTHSGEYSNGITTIQCMYAPEFSAHSEGVRVTVK